MSDSKRLALLIAVMSAARASAAAALPLSTSEAYYWLWGQHPAAGYFDHPPMTGVMGAAFFGWVIGSPLAARSAPIILGAITTVVVYFLGRALFPETRTGWRAALLFSIMPICDLGGVMIQPDNSLGLFVALTWLAFWRAAEKPETLGRWLAAGLAAGCALLSKFHAWVLLPPLYLFLILAPSRRAALRRPGPWIAIVVALGLLVPNLIWNARHDWINYAFQWRRSTLPKAEFEPGQVANFFAAPFAALSPLVCLAMLAGVWKGFKSWRATGDPAAIFLLLAGLPLPLFLGALSPWAEISIHWPALGYLALVILAVGLIERGDLLGARWRSWMFGSCAAIVAILHLFALVADRLPSRINYPFAPQPFSVERLKAEMVGWDEIGAKARALREALSVEGPAVVMGKSWHSTSMFAFYGRLPRECFVLEREDAHNFAIWMEERGGLKGAGAIVILEKSKPNQRHATLETKYDRYHRLLDPIFASVKPLPSLACFSDGAIEDFYGVDVSRPLLREFLIFECRGFKGELVGK